MQINESESESFEILVFPRKNRTKKQDLNLSIIPTDSVIQANLKRILESSKRNYKGEILNQPDLKHAHIYCKIEKLSGQISGPLIESYIQQKFKMTKNNSSLCIGDLQHKDINIEIKSSFGGKEHNKFNYVQLRMNHDCEYILTAYYISELNLDELGELFIFRLNKEDIKKIILNHGSYAHGTIQKLGKITEEDLNNTMSDNEYVFRPKYGDKCWQELLQFRIDEISI